VAHHRRGHTICVRQPETNKNVNMRRYYRWGPSHLRHFPASYGPFLSWNRVPNMQPLLEDGCLRLECPFGPHQLFRVVLTTLQPLRIHSFVLCIPSGLYSLVLLWFLIKAFDPVPRKKAADTHDECFNVHGLRETLL